MIIVCTLFFYVMCFKQIKNKNYSFVIILSIYDMSWLGVMSHVMYVPLYNLCHSVGHDYSTEKHLFVNLQIHACIHDVYFMNHIIGYILWNISQDKNV